GGKNPEEMEKMKNIFIQGLKGNKVSEKKAETLYSLILKFAQYGFNKSHSAAYAYIAYQTAFLKAHYPVEFMAASLSADMDNTPKVVMFINECKDMGIEILPPDINDSGREFRVKGNSIRFGLEAVKGVGGSAIDAVLETRAEKGFTSFTDFCVRADSRRVNKKVIESLIKAGAMDSMGKRAQLMEGLPDVMEAAVRYQRELNLGQASMFGDIHEIPAERLPIVDEWSESKLLSMEKEALGFYITGHPLNRYKEKLAELGVVPSTELPDLQEKQDVNLCGIVTAVKKIQTKKTGDLMAYVTLEDMYSAIEVILFPDIFREVQEMIAQDIPLIIAGYLDKTDKGIKVIAKQIVTIENSGQIKKQNTARKPRTENNGEPGGSRARVSSGPQGAANKSLTLTMFNDTKPETLPELAKIFSKYSGDHRVFLKIISPKNWETVLSTDRHVMPSEEMLIEVEELLGKERITFSGLPGAREIRGNELRTGH
ncbi:MAG: OB-fold nucleic acid binding domain-containing protein, partial [Nitrospirota bacterium]